jgi:hypothetical protein
LALTDTSWIRWLGFAAQGDLGGITTYTNKKRRIVFYPQAPPLSPPSAIQEVQQLNFQAACAMWRNLTQAERNDYGTSVAFTHARITGFNLFMSAALKFDATDLIAIEKKTGIPLATPWA